MEIIVIVIARSRATNTGTCIARVRVGQCRKIERADDDDGYYLEKTDRVDILVAMPNLNSQ